MQRVCFLLKVREDRIAEYRERHAAVWPEMLQALSATGWHNYSLFLRDDGLLVGYLETEDFEAALAGMSQPQFRKHSDALAPYIVPGSQHWVVFRVLET